MNFKTVWGKWLKASRIIGNFNVLLIFTLIYFTILWIPGFFTRFFSDPLKVKKTKSNSNFSTWKYTDDLGQSRKSY